ncbi:hypothetical protein GQ600_17877 [Phytophthora cactorum]|nr:hypothetical protein GQ600_17877 [Phytophthora cactorum]
MTLFKNVSASCCQQPQATRQSLFLFSKVVLDTLSCPSFDHTQRENIESLTKVVQGRVGIEVTYKFGLMLDGWTHGSEHYLAVFGCYEISAPPRHPLFSLAPIVVDGSGRLDAEIHMAALAAFLPSNTTGPAPKRAPTSPVTDETAKGTDSSGQLAFLIRLKTSLRPKLHRQTRWGRRTPYWLAILSCISADDEELDDLMLSPAANRRLKALLAEMGDIESISTKLQSEELNLLGARDLLELPAGDQAKFTNYLGSFGSLHRLLTCRFPKHHADIYCI